MPVSAREMLLVVRAQNYSSQALRRVAADVGALASVKGLKQRGQVLTAQRASLLAAQRQTREELKTFSTGQAYFNLRKKHAVLEGNMASSRKAVLASEKAALNLQAQRLRNEAQISFLTRASKGQGSGLAALMGISSKQAAEYKLRLAAAQKQAETFAISERQIALSTEKANASIAAQQIHLQQLEAEEAALVRRQKELQALYAKQSGLLAVNAQKQAEISKAINSAKWDKVSVLGSTMMHVSRVVQYAGMAIGGVLGYAAYQAAQFQTQSTLAATQITNKWHQTARGVMQAGKLIQQGLLDMTIRGKTAAAMEENQQAIYDIYSSMTLKGNQKTQIKEGLAILSIFNKAAIAGQVPLADVTKAGITILNNFSKQGRQVQDLPKFLNRMFASVRYGRMTVSDFVGAMQQVAPAFSGAFGPNARSFDMLAQAMAVITRYQPSIRMGATGLARLVEMFARKDFVEGAKKLGLNIVDVTGHLKPLDDIISLLVAKFPSMRKGGVELQNIFKTITAAGSKTGKGGTLGTMQARRDLQILITHWDEYHQVAKQVMNDNNEFTKSFIAMSNTSGVKWQIFVKQIHAFVIEIGQQVIPVLAKLGAPLMQVFRWFNTLSEGTKKNIATWLTWGAAITILGSGLSFLLGMAIRIFAVFGRGMGFVSAIAFGFLAISAAIRIVNGDWKSLNDVIDGFLHMATDTPAGWIIMLTGAAFAAMKLRTALLAVRDGYIAAGAASAATGGGGMFVGLGGLGRSGTRVAGDMKAAASLGREVGGMKGAITATSLAAAAIPGSVWLIAAAVAAAAGGALILKRHFDAVKKSEEAAAVQAQILKNISEAPLKSAQQLSGLGDAARAVARAKLDVDAINKQITTAKKAGAGKDELTQLYLDRADAVDRYNAANNNANKDFAGLSNSFSAQARLLRQIAKEQQRLDLLNKTRAIGGGRAASAGMLGNVTGFINDLFGAKAPKNITAIRNTTRAIQELSNASVRGATALRTSFGNVIDSLSRAKFIPTLTENQIQHLYRVALKKGRMLTIPEIRANIQSIVIGNVPKVVKPSKAFNIPTFFIPPKQDTIKKVQSGVAQVFRKKIIQTVTIHPTPKQAQADAAKIGANIAQGIGQGINANYYFVTNAVVAVMDQAIAAAHQHGEGHSPYMLFAKTVGKNIGQGIAVGILLTAGDIQKAAMLTLDLFQGQVMANYDTTKATKLQIDRAVHSLTVAEAAMKKKRTEANRQRVQIAQENLAELRARGKPVTAATLTADLQSQLRAMITFNSALAKLTRRGAPQQLVEQLASLGLDSAANINKLANMSAPALRRYIKLWQQTQTQISKSQRIMKADMTSALKTLAADAAQTLLQTWQGFQETNKSNFGDLFAGLEDKIGQGFQDALDAYNNNVTDYQNQLLDLNKQIADAQKQAADQAVSEMQTAFGPLFSGDWISGDIVKTKLDWGQKLGFDDLFKDLQTQVDKFNRWQNDLTSLAAKLPPELAKQLAALGPDAVDQLDILNGATNEQLAQYVALWQTGQQAIGKAASASLSTNADLANTMSGLLTQVDEITQKLAALQRPQELTGQDLIDSVNKQITAWGDYQGTLADLVRRGLPGELVMQLSQLGPTAEPYLKALNNMSDDQLFGPNGFVTKWQTANDLILQATNRMMGQQLSLWYKYGARSAAELIAGVSSEQQPLIDYFTGLFYNLLSGKTPNFNPPGQVDHTPDALDRYLNNQQSGTRTTAGTTVNMNVTAQQNETLDTTLARATFRLTRMNPV